jgi:hypothetical protein
MPCRPVPYEVVIVSKPAPSSTTSNARCPSTSDNRTVAWLAPAYLATFCVDGLGRRGHA